MLNRGIEILNENLNKVKNNFFPGEVAFKLYDTYGFPLDLTADILKNKNIKVDNVGFDKEMEKSKKLARANWKGSGDKSLEEKWFKVREQLNPTEFLGYEFDKLEGVILKISKGKDFVEEAKIGDEVEIVTNQTPFYAESGGQVGDQGVIYSNDLSPDPFQLARANFLLFSISLSKPSLSIFIFLFFKISAVRSNGKP